MDQDIFYLCSMANIFPGYLSNIWWEVLEEACEQGKECGFFPCTCGSDYSSATQSGGLKADLPIVPGQIFDLTNWTTICAKRPFMYVLVLPCLTCSWQSLPELRQKLVLNLLLGSEAGLLCEGALQGVFTTQPFRLSSTKMSALRLWWPP